MNEIIDFSSNLNPVGFDLDIARIISEKIDTVYHYPDSSSIASILEDRLDISKHSILLGGGSVALIHILPRYFFRGTTIIQVPTFCEYENAVNINKGKIIYYTLEEKLAFHLDYKKVIALMKGADLLFICNPNNPTGDLISRDIILEIIKEGKKKETFIVVDEAFIDFTDNPLDNTLIPYIKEYNNLAVIRSFTKYFSLPGLRLGFLAANRYFIDKISGLLGPWPISTLSIAVFEELLKNNEFQEKTREWLMKERAYLYNGLNEISWISPYSSQANYILWKINKDHIKNNDINLTLRKKNILTRDCSNFPGLNDKFHRVAVKSRENNSLLLKELKSAFGS